MYKQPPSLSRELMVWKHSECIDCEFTLTCPKGLDNLKMCFSEDGLNNSRTVDALIKRTIRFVCKERRNERRGVHQENINKRRSLWSIAPKCIDAVMHCSDIEEFVACQKSG